MPTVILSVERLEEMVELLKQGDSRTVIGLLEDIIEEVR